MQNIVRIDAQNIVWRVHRSPSEQYIGACDPLRLVAQASTYEELLSTINEILREVLLMHFEEGTLERFLSSHGWQAVGPVTDHPVFDVPFDVERARRAHA